MEQKSLLSPFLEVVYSHGLCFCMPFSVPREGPALLNEGGEAVRIPARQDSGEKQVKTVFPN